MPSSAAETARPRRVGAGVLVGLTLTLATALGACSSTEPAPADSVAASETAAGTSGGSTSGSSSAVGRTTRPRLRIPPDVVIGIRAALAERAEALRSRDEATYAAGIADDGVGFATSQQVYYANLAQLPLADLDYAFDRRSMVRTGDDYWVTVEVRMKLDGFDAVPVVTEDRYRFTPGSREGTFLLASVTNPAWERSRDVRDEPWDSGAVVVRQGPGVLGIFDATSAPYADELLPTVSQGIADVASRIPYDWSRSVVLYALSDTGYLGGIPDLPGGDPERLDGAAFPVFSRRAGDEVASTRFVLHPRLLTRPGSERERLVRHELTHVALGERDDEVPVWLSEGLAEYVSVQALPAGDRRVSEAAVEQAVAGVRELPADDVFNGDQSRANYGLAWWLCEYLADTYGQPVLWHLLDALAPEAGAPVDAATAVQDLTGLTTRQLARKSAKLLLRTYAPEELATAPPSETPETPGSSGSAGSSGSGQPGESPSGAGPTPGNPGRSPGEMPPTGSGTDRGRGSGGE